MTRYEAYDQVNDQMTSNANDDKRGRHAAENTMSRFYIIYIMRTGKIATTRFGTPFCRSSLDDVHSDINSVHTSYDVLTAQSAAGFRSPSVIRPA